VRFDGGHKLDHFLASTLAKYVAYVPVCPEVACGMGVPREAMRLMAPPENPQLVGRRTRADFTPQMAAWARQRVCELEREELCGFIFKSKWPSCGMERVKLYDASGTPRGTGTGIFARTFMSHFTLLPVEEEGRLNDPGLRENFVECIFVLSRWRELTKQRRSAAGLVLFHSRHKLLILAHSPKHYQAMGRLVAHIMLQHMMGYFKRQLSAFEKQELLDLIGRYCHGDLPLVVPMTLISHYVHKYEQPYLSAQFFINPHPQELKLRNHV